MGYIIENANILKESQLTKSSLLIEDNLIVARKERFTHTKLMKMNADAFIMTPTYVHLDSNIPLKAAFQDMRKYMLNNFLLKGCTTFITYVKVSYENELVEMLKEVKTDLIGCPIDFLICVKIPLRLLTPSFIRKCKSEKIPGIFLEVENLDDLNEIPWGWIREAMFPYNSLLIPIFSWNLKKEAKRALSKWKVIMEKEKIPAFLEEIKENEPLSIPTLNKFGLYPQKGSLNQGTEVSYNLFIKGREILNVDEVNLFHYHCDRLVVTMHKGKIVRAGEEVLFKPGYGEHIKVKTPSYFSL